MVLWGYGKFRLLYVRRLRTHSDIMNSTDQIKMLLSSFAMQIPILLVCLVAGVIILVRWKQTARGAVWALLGFGLAFILCILIPIVQTSVQSWVMQSGDIDFAHRASVLSGLSILWSVLRAISYALLLVAVIAGRSAPQLGPPTPLSQSEKAHVA